jgi:hypothetical protein
VDIGSTIEVEYQLTTKGKPFVSGSSFSRPWMSCNGKPSASRRPPMCEQTFVTGTPES